MQGPTCISYRPATASCGRPNWRGFGDSILRRPHQSTDREFRLEVRWYREPLSAATCKAPMQTEGWLKSPGNRGGLTSSRPAEAVPQKTAKSAEPAVLWLLGCPDWGFPCFSSVVRRMPGHNEKRGTAHLPITEAFSRSDPSAPKSQRPSAKTTPTLLGSTPRKTIQPKFSDEV
jgi:hypothetical protein